MWNMMSQMQEKILYDTKLETITLKKIPRERLKQIITVKRQLLMSILLTNNLVKILGFITSWYHHQQPQQQLYSYPKIENYIYIKLIQIKSNEYMAARNNHTGLIRNWAAILSV